MVQGESCVEILAGTEGSRRRQLKVETEGDRWLQLTRKEFSGFRLQNMMQLQVVRYGCRIQRTEGVQQLRAETEGARRLQAGIYGTPLFHTETERGRRSMLG